MSDILSVYPKVRPALPEEYQAVYAKHYAINRKGMSAATSVASRLESWMHRRVASDVATSGRSLSTLEVGAGTLNHLPYEAPHTDRYDVVEPFVELYEGEANKRLVRCFYSDISEIADEVRYDRIVSVATFEHILNLPEVVEKCRALLNPGGVLRVAVPSEGTVLWKLGYTLTTGIEFRRKYGLSYETLMRHEHVNTAREVRLVIEHFFGAPNVACFGLCPALSLYQYFEVTR